MVRVRLAVASITRLGVLAVAVGCGDSTAPAVPTQLAFSVQPTSITGGQAISPAVQVEVRDAAGTRVAGDRTAITVAIGTNLGGAALAGTKTANAVDGIASFSGLSLDKAGTGYTLVASGGSLTGATSAAFNVAASPAIMSFTASQETITTGTSTTLTATFAGGTGTVDHGVGAVVSGTQVSTGSLTATTTFTLTVTNGETTVTAPVTVTVVPAPVITSFVPGQSVVTTGNGTTLRGLFTGGTGAITNNVGPEVVGVYSGTLVATQPLIATTLYTLTVTNAAGTSVTRSVTVTAVPPPVISGFFAGQTPITSGSSTTLTATFGGGTGVVDHGVGTVFSGTPISTGPLTVTTTFSLTVTNAAGTSVTNTVTVTVQ